MKDEVILALYFARDEQAVAETDKRQPNMRIGDTKATLTEPLDRV